MQWVRCLWGSRHDVNDRLPRTPTCQNLFLNPSETPVLLGSPSVQFRMIFAEIGLCPSSLYVTPVATVLEGAAENQSAVERVRPVQFILHVPGIAKTIGITIRCDGRTDGVAFGGCFEAASQAIAAVTAATRTVIVKCLMAHSRHGRSWDQRPVAE
jgi:hypothetical protein